MASRLQLFFSTLRPAVIKDNHTYATSSEVSEAGTTSAFKCTVDGSRLTNEQRIFYEDNGFFVIRKLVAPEKLELFRQRFLQICRREVKVPNITFMRDIAIKDTELGPGQHAINKIQDWQEDPVLFQYCTLPEILSYIEGFTGPDIVAGHSMLINKPPDTGKLTSRHPLHQDLYYSPYRPANRVVCAWTAMQKITRENGCLVVVPGTHKGGILPHVYPEWEGGVNKMYHGIKDFDAKSPRVHLEMEEGDTVFFHPLLIHGSGANRSENYRKSISCHYVSSDCEVLKNLDPVQKPLVDELVALRKKLYGDAGDNIYQEFYLQKARHVQGKVGNFGRPQAQ